MRKVLPPPESYHLINPGPCCLITSGDRIRKNVAPINWTMPLLDDPAWVVSAVEPGIQTDLFIRSSKEFVINVMTERQADAIFFCGTHSGKSVDKFKATGLRTVPSVKVKPPRLAAAVAHIECRLQRTIRLKGIHLHMAKVVHAEVESRFYRHGRLLAERARTLHHTSGPFFVVPQRVVKAR
ncbi:MAG TPA: flavin reductase family protein [Elusimicrobiota bacterium]|nr:flavin reductase family protein [Elusimicrobiota bacterium]